jgi:Flp pilus assembly protein TadG
MKNQPAVVRLQSLLGRFGRSEQGNIAMLFGIAVVPIITFVGAAVDYTRANTARSSMQAAMDSTSLMLAKDLQDGTINTSQITQKAQDYFKALYANADAKQVGVTATYTAAAGNGSKIEIAGNGKIDTSFMRLVGIPDIKFNTNATSAWGNVRMRVAMALDVTGSMRDDGKMPAMQTAAKSLIDQLSPLAKNPGDIYISVVPFAKDVNLGTSFRNETWIDWSEFGKCSSTSYTTKKSCQDANRTWTVESDKTKWSGCVTDRDKDYDTKNTPPTSANAPTMVFAEEYISGSDKYCKVGNDPYMPPIMPLSYDWAALKTMIGTLQPTGNTNQGIGLAWAWLTLGNSTPFNAPAKDTANYTYKEAIILLSDGMNTQNRFTSSTSQIDARQKILCDNAKATGVTIYTIHVNTGGDPTSSVLKYCASGADKFYEVKQANQTLSVFNSIGQSLAKLRIAK